jgi:hypothetical protein
VEVGRPWLAPIIIGRVVAKVALEAFDKFLVKWDPVRLKRPFIKQVDNG